MNLDFYVEIFLFFNLKFYSISYINNFNKISFLFKFIINKFNI